MKSILPVLVALVLGVALGAGGALILHHSNSGHWITLPTAYDLSTGTRHVVDPLNCRIGDPGYSGRAVCSWVRNP